MAIAVGSAGRTGRRGRRAGHAALAEMNVVPLVDVVLVLLIIFMLTAQIMEFGLEIDVPKISQSRESAQPLPVISITRNGTTYLNEKTVNLGDIRQEVQKQFGANVKAVYIKSDKNVLWDVLAQVVSAVSQAKYEVRLVTKSEDITDRRR